MALNNNKRRLPTTIMDCSCADLLRLLRSCSERAAQLARTCRQADVFIDAVQEKADIVKNKTVMQDFKTVADVMVQAMVRHYISAEYPALADHILGEESCQFTAADGTSLQLGVQATERETAELMTQAMGGAGEVAAKMATVIHGRPPDVSPVAAEHTSQLEQTRLPLDDLAVWIDPIDGTGEYVRGAAGRSDDVISGLVTSGLPTVTVLVGVFLRSSGQPVMGVVTQPFSGQQTDGWVSAHYWGVCFGDVRVSNVPAAAAAAAAAAAPAPAPAPAAAAAAGDGDGGGSAPVIMTSRSERDDVITALRDAGLRPVAASGAGYKLLQVVLGSAAGFVVSLSSTFLWDTCGPDALLRALGGSLVFKDGTAIRYDHTADNSRNCGLLLAARDEETRSRLLSALCNCYVP